MCSLLGIRLKCCPTAEAAAVCNVHHVAEVLNWFIYTMCFVWRVFIAIDAAIEICLPVFWPVSIRVLA